MFKLKGIRFRKGKQKQMYEYWCQDCKQLRLAFVDVATCGNCGSKRIVKGEVGKLVKE